MFRVEFLQVCAFTAAEKLYALISEGFVKAGKRKPRTVDIGHRKRPRQTAPTRDTRQIQRIVPGQIQFKQIKNGEFFISHNYTIHIYRWKRKIKNGMPRTKNLLTANISEYTIRVSCKSFYRRYDKKRRLKYRRRFLSRVCMDVCRRYVYVSF